MTKLTEIEWQKVFSVRCKSKQGQLLSDDEHRLIDQAYKEDRARYAAMNRDVFNATVPFGSTVRR
jgi:hypothetical protein